MNLKNLNKASRSSWNAIYKSLFSKIIGSKLRSKINSNHANAKPGYFKGCILRENCKNIEIN